MAKDLKNPSTDQVQAPAPQGSTESLIRELLEQSKAQQEQIKALQARLDAGPTALAADGPARAIKVYLEDREDGLRRERASIRFNEEFKTECAKSSLQRTQEAADRMFTGPDRFQVCIPKEKSQPVILIAAHSPDEARGRYASLCGIRATDHEYSVVPAGEAALMSVGVPAKSGRSEPMTLESLHGGEE